MHRPLRRNGSNIGKKIKHLLLQRIKIKKIIEKHGGRVWINSILNEGTALYFTIPLRRI